MKCHQRPSEPYSLWAKVSASSREGKSCALRLFAPCPRTSSPLSSTPFDVPSGGTVTLTITGTLAYTVTPGLVITNTATTLFTSLPGSPGVISTYNPNSTERTGADGVGGALNNYASKGSVIITVINPQAAKTLVTTRWY